MAFESRGRIGLGLMLLSLSAMAAGVGGCATRQTGKAQPSGFLGDYSKLHRGRKGQAQLIYINRNVDWKKYDSVIIDPVTVWLASEATNLPPKDQARLTSRLENALEEQLGKDYHIVDEPGPRVMRLRVAITEVQGAKLLMNAVTGLVPQARLVTMVGGMATDTAVLVGKASVEGELLDSMTGTRLLAGVDQRAGTKDPAHMTNKWSDVESAFNAWAEKLRKRLAELRAA